MSCKEEMESWRVQSPEEPGFHAVITPDTCACQETQIFRLNLPKGESYHLESGKLEMHPVLIAGAAKLSDHALAREMKRFDAFYLPGGDSVTITALEDCIFYIAAAVYEGYGKAFFRAFEKDAPVGDIHQIHGEGSHGAAKAPGPAGPRISTRRIWKRFTATSICRCRTSAFISAI